MSLNYVGPLIIAFFSLNIQLAVCIPRFRIHVFNPLQISIFHPCEELRDVEVWLYALSYAILYKGLEHLWILVSKGVLTPIHCRYWGTTVIGILNRKQASWIMYFIHFILALLSLHIFIAMIGQSLFLAVPSYFLEFIDLALVNYTC